LKLVLNVAGLVLTDHVVRPTVHTPTPDTWDDNAITLAWLGHASVLVNFYGVRILTDPVLFPRIGVDVWVTTLGPLRLTSCALAPSQLPARSRARVACALRSPGQAIAQCDPGTACRCHGAGDVGSAATPAVSVGE